ncbi:multicopper oxidase family protein [Terriglobus roseus]|uniref:Multicopper oxidase with three cupredoxin domains (Includes cell division protein FtsP and spore coat protein CotA) n=1 Tax=Terriglobus roseus TaxID=392734 RepID=A0A1G7J7R4_9BACT|nr:multicopper oxidase family protein [Terriglobus roseus]SDF20928.1 Multicopper oxidase with three cupredoxin domains (includes cell division protein FtsP and spore coat protein CotA) [Terriglobus roseus]
MATSWNLNRRQFLAGSAICLADSFVSPLGHRPRQELNLHLASSSLEIANNRFIRTTSYANYPAGSVVRLQPDSFTDIRITNSTDQEEFVHWHGLRVSASLDGTPEEESLSVSAVGVLSYALPPSEPGFYFAHSHAMCEHDLSRGPYSGQFVPMVIGSLQCTEHFDREVFLTSHEWEPSVFDTAGNERSLEAMHHLRVDSESEEGEEVPDDGWDIVYRAATINGKILGEGEPIRVRNNERILFRILNASATERLQLSLPGHRFLVVALDGYPVPKPAFVEVVELGVGERLDAIVVMDTPGIWVMGSPEDRHRALGMGVVVEYADRSGKPIWSPPAGTSAWDYLRFSGSAVNAAPCLSNLSYRIERRPSRPDGFERWAMVPLSSAQETLRVGERCRITLLNNSDEAHPMHLHRFPFELTSVSGQPCAGIRKDTVVVPPFQQVQFDVQPDSSGPTLLHCHNQMHMDCGLKTLLSIS